MYKNTLCLFNQPTFLEQDLLQTWISKELLKVSAADRCCPLTHTQTRLMALCPGLPRWAGTRKVKPIWISLKQETVSGSGISWAICKSASRSRQITTPAPHHSVFYRPDALPAAEPAASKHWSQRCCPLTQLKFQNTERKCVTKKLH